MNRTMFIVHRWSACDWRIILPLYVLIKSVESALSVHLLDQFSQQSWDSNSLSYILHNNIYH